MQKDIISHLENVLNETIQILESFNETELNKIPFKESWTAGQVGCHLLKSETGMDNLLYAPSETVNRASDKNVEELKKIFLDFTVKFKSPDFIIPEDKEYNKQELLSDLKEVKNKIIKAAENVKLDEIAPLPDGHPFIGYTKLEMIHFLTYHTTRHNRQIKNIKMAIKSA